MRPCNAPVLRIRWRGDRAKISSLDPFALIHLQSLVQLIPQPPVLPQDGLPLLRVLTIYELLGDQPRADN